MRVDEALCLVNLWEDSGHLLCSHLLVMSEIAFVVQFAHAVLLVRVLKTCPVLLSVFFFVG